MILGRANLLSAIFTQAPRFADGSIEGSLAVAQNPEPGSGVREGGRCGVRDLRTWRRTEGIPGDHLF